jgi:Na+/proline symporter
VVFAQFVLFLGVGIGLAAYYDKFPPVAPFAKADEVFATFIVRCLPVGAVGIVLASVFSAAMSTLASSLNSCAAVLVNDLLPRREETSEGVAASRTVNLSRWLTVVFGLLQVAVGCTGAYLSSSVINSVLAIAGFTTGIVLGVFLLGVLTTHVGQRAALFGMLGGLIVICGVALRTDVAWPWYTLIGSTTTCGLGLAFQGLVGRRPEH